MGDPGEIRVFAKSDACAYLDMPSVRSFIARCLRHALRGLSRLPSSVDVDDLVQETLVILWRRQQETERPYSLSYVARASRYVLIDCLRHAGAKKRGRGKTAEFPCEVCEPAASAEDRMLADERLHVLLTRLRSTVPPRTFEAVRLRCIEGLSSNEAASRLGVSASGVNTALHRARRAVRSRP